MPGQASPSAVLGGKQHLASCRPVAMISVAVTLILARGLRPAGVAALPSHP
jgi:hypothetical protein